MTTLENPQVTAKMEKAKRYLRLFLRDTPELNRLLRTKETPDDLIEFAIEMTISDWNTTPPFIGPVTIMNFPGLYMLMMGAAINVLASQGIYQARNELTYQAGGSSFQRFNKSNYYMQWMINLDNKYQQNKRNMKLFQNVERGWGGANSEYDRLGFMW